MLYKNFTDEPIGSTELSQLGICGTVPHVAPWRRRAMIRANEGNLQSWHTLEELIDLVKTNNVIELAGVVWNTSRLELIRQALESVGTPKLLFYNLDFGIRWPDHVRAIEINAYPYQFSTVLHNSKIKPVYRKQVSSLNKTFFVMAKGHDPGRRELLASLHNLGLMDDAIYSADFIQSNDFEHLLKHLGTGKLPDVQSHLIGDRYERYDLRRNIPTLLPIMETCHFHVSLSNNILIQDIKQPVGDKAMWAVCSGTPTMLISTPHEQARMQAWGFELEYLPSVLPHEEHWQALQRWTAMILLWHNIVTDPDKAQQWHDEKAESVAKNNALSRNLHQTIRQHIQQQLDELPREWQSLK